MAGPITKEQVKKIIKKLGATNVTDKGDEHDHYAVWHNEVLVAKLGVRRAPKRDMPHPHIPGQLRVSENFVRQIASCQKERDDWLREIGEIQDEPN